MEDIYIGITKPLNIVSQASSNIDAKYGPYYSLSEALSTIPQVLRGEGLTVGIIGNDGIQEYWFKKGIQNNHLILKSESSGALTGLEELISNKQNNLSPDSTNKKYPTVSAVLSGLSNKVDKVNGSFLMTQSERDKLASLTPGGGTGGTYTSGVGINIGGDSSINVIFGVTENTVAKGKHTHTISDIIDFSPGGGEGHVHANKDILDLFKRDAQGNIYIDLASGKSFYSTGNVAAYGIGTGGGGTPGTSEPPVHNLDSTSSTLALSAGMGKVLDGKIAAANLRIDNLSGGGTTTGITQAEADLLYKSINYFPVMGDIYGLSTALAGKADSNHTHSEFHSHNNKGFLDTINQNLSTTSTPSFADMNVDGQSVKTFMTKFNSMFDIVGGNIQAKMTLYSVANVAAYGMGSVNPTEFSLYSGLDRNITNTGATSSTVFTLNNRIVALENSMSGPGGEIVYITTNGSGNAVTSVTKSGANITVTRGTTFSVDGHGHSISDITSLQNTLDGKVNNTTYNTFVARRDNPHVVTKAQVGLTNVTNVLQASKSEFDARVLVVNNHINDKANPHAVTKKQVGLEFVTNESKATMFANPTFTGTVSGVTKSMVGLSNVDNVKQATKTEFDNFVALRNNPHQVTKAQVGLDNVDNIQQATKTEFTALKNLFDSFFELDVPNNSIRVKKTIYSVANVAAYS